MMPMRPFRPGIRRPTSSRWRRPAKRNMRLPMYVNAALRDPFNPGKAPSYESGAPTDNNIELWKIARRLRSAWSRPTSTCRICEVHEGDGSLQAQGQCAADSGDRKHAGICAICICGDGQWSNRLGAIRVGLDPLQQSDVWSGSDGVECVEACCASSTRCWRRSRA